MLRLFLDTNIVISGLLFHGPEEALLLRAESGTFIAVVSPDVLQETVRVLAGKFGLPQARVDGALAALRFLEVVTPDADGVRRAERALRDADDAPILAAARVAHVEGLVTGDRDLHALGGDAGLRVLTTTEALDLIER